jgi:hypothetical protein
MDYHQIDAIKKMLDDQDCSLAMLIDLKQFVEAKVKAWGKQSGATYRIM